VLFAVARADAGADVAERATHPPDTASDTSGAAPVAPFFVSGSTTTHDSERRISVSDYANPNSLVETDWLEAHTDDPAIRVIEVDEDTTAYEKGHIRSAVGWNWSTDLHAEVGREYVSREELSELLARAGVDEDTTVVLYGGNNNWFAAYAYWILKLRGFDAVKLLNGGRKKWELESRELTQDVPNPQRTGFRISGSERPGIRALRDEVISKVGSGVALVDVRSPEEFRGEKLAPDHLPQEQSQVPGHIPGAANIPWAKAANEDGTFKSAEELRALYEAEGVTDDKEVIAYCRIGERSSHTWFALQELLGYPDVKNYDGSWTEYGSLVGAPVERG
jgi:thiosulfate/3-mercaptopyruvate sulfurtransferase